MLESRRADGYQITPEYSPRYAKFKGFEFPNLYLTGAFQGDMFFMTEGKDFFITSSDDKMPALVDRYSEKIFGIPVTRQDEAQQIAHDSLARIYNKEVLNG
jgi:hypothetical protein